MTVRAGYLIHDDGGDPLDHNPEFSRRARGFAVYAAIRSLGRTGIVDLVERSCALARRFAERLGADDRVEVLNDVVLNQAAVRSWPTTTSPAGWSRRSRTRAPAG